MAITITKEVEVEVEVDIHDFDEDDLKRLGVVTGVDLDDPHVDAMVYAIKNDDREALFQAARNWIRCNSQLAL